MKIRRAATRAILVPLLFATSAAASESLGVDSVRSRFGANPAEALLGSASLSDRVRGIERLGSLGTPRAVARLVTALSPGTVAATSEERLTAVRELSKYTEDPAVRRCLVGVALDRELGTGIVRRPLDDLVRTSAALALAASGDAEAIANLGKALSTPGTIAEGAAAALLAHPPRDVRALSRHAVPSVPWVTVLERFALADVGQTLRGFVLRGAPEVRARAALALFQLGDREAVTLAKRWANASRDLHEKSAAAKILSLAADPAAPPAVTALLQSEESADLGLEIAFELPNAAYVAALEALLTRVSDSRATKIFIALGRGGGPRAASVLEKALRIPTHAVRAAEALARMPGPEASRVLSRALSDDGLRRLAVRASTFRGLISSETPEGFREAVRVLSRSPSSPDRAVASAALVAQDPANIERVLKSKEPSTTNTVLPLVLLGGPFAARTVASQIAVASAGTSSATWIALAEPSAAAAVPTLSLVASAEAGGAGSLVTVRELSSRDDPRIRPRLLELLSSKDPLLRAHVALGLGASPSPDATGLLDSAYTFEEDARVRLAIARALSLRPEDPLRDLALGTCRDLDPDPEVRDIARKALEGVRSEVELVGTTAVWVRVLDDRGGPAPEGTPVQIATAGVSLPCLTGPDGIVLAAGLAKGPVEVRVAPGNRTVNHAP